MHQQHHRQRRFGLPFRVRRQGEIGDQLQPVAGADDGAAHRRQAIGLEIGTRGEELGDLASVPLVEVIGGRRLRRARNHDPAVVVARPVGDADLAGQQAVQPLQVVGHALLERDPVEGEVLGADGLDRKRRGVSDEMADVRLRVLGQHTLLARLPIGGEQGRRVAAHRRETVEGAAVAREADGVGRQIVLVLDDADRLELVAVDAVADAATLRRAGLGGEPRAQLAIEHDARQLLAVLQQQLALAAANIDAVEVVPGLVAVVDRDGHHVGLVEAHVEDAGLHAGDGREIARLAASDPHRIDMEVLGAALVLQIEHVEAVVGPAMKADAALLVAGDDARGAQVARRSQPDVEDAILGRDPGQPAPIGRNLGLRPSRIAEQLGARNERERGGRVHGSLSFFACASSGRPILAPP